MLCHKRRDVYALKNFIRIICVLFLVLVTVFKFDWNSETPQYSASLTRTVTDDGGTEHIDYVNTQGKITYAEDLHYASVVRTRDDFGRLISDFYYDENGNPAEQPDGYYGLKRTYDALGRNDTVIYTDSDGDPIITNLGYAMMAYVFDENDRIIEQWYLDVDGNLTENRYGAYGTVHVCDEQGRRVTSTHVDKNKNPLNISLGFAAIKREFYENGLMKRAFYFDEKGNPVQSVFNQYGYYYEYDDSGRNIVSTYIDAVGNPMIASVGYATIKKTYDEITGIVVTEMYFDDNGEPISLIKGQYGVRYDGEKQIYLDKNGRDIFSLYTLLYNNPMMVVLFGLVVSAVSILIGKKGNIVLLAAYIAFIIYMTLMNRNADEARVGAAFLWSYREFFKNQLLRQEILNNIWLFIPLGTILYRLTGWLGMCVVLMLSAGIEVVQYFGGFGLAEFDDVLSNGIGGFIGCGTGMSTAANLLQNRDKSTPI